MDKEPSSQSSTWLQLFLKGWAHWFHIVYIVLLIALYITAGVYKAENVKVLIAYIALFVYIIFLMGFLGYFIYSYSRKARYAEAMSCIHSAVHELRNINIYLDRCLVDPLSYEPSKFNEVLRTVLDSVVLAFSIVSAVSNRATIKVLGGERDSEYVTTLCRDNASHRRNLKRDHSEGEAHKVDKNTDFHLIVRGEQRYFLSNNLRKYPNYMNTSLGDKDLNAEKWQLPYIASLVLPIRCIIDKFNNTAADADTSRIIILGFLAIDTMSRGAYSERYDVDMGAIIADTLYPVLTHWSKVEAASQDARGRQSRSI